ncbi:MAG: hypothetical protein IKV87_02665 [Methanobrevibacter sp.]|nr:hypothetical protein [Methanobrevibacter sp.]
MEIKSIPQIINEIQESLDQNDYESAYDIAKDNVDLNKEYLEGEYVFKNLLEELLFQVLIQGEIKKKIPLILDYSTLYSNYGEILLHFDKIEDGKKSFALSKNYNPINIKANFGLAEIAKMESNIEEFYKLSIESFKIAYYPKDLAKSFRNLSFYFLRIAEDESSKDNLEENLRLAISLKKISQDFDEDSDLAMHELNEINEKINKFDKELVESIENMDLNDCKSFLKSKGLPYEAGIEIITICKNLGFQLDEAKKVVPALFYFNIAYDLTKDEDIKLVIDDLNEKVERKLNE